MGAPYAWECTVHGKIGKSLAVKCRGLPGPAGVARVARVLSCTVRGRRFDPSTHLGCGPGPQCRCVREAADQCLSPSPLLSLPLEDEKKVQRVNKSTSRILILTTLYKCENPSTPAGMAVINTAQ